MGRFPKMGHAGCALALLQVLLGLALVSAITNPVQVRLSSADDIQLGHRESCTSQLKGKTFSGSYVNDPSWFVEMGFQEHGFALNERLTFVSDTSADLSFWASETLSNGRAPPFACSGETAVRFSANCKDGVVQAVHLDLSSCPQALAHESLKNDLHGRSSVDLPYDAADDSISLRVICPHLPILHMNK